MRSFLSENHQQAGLPRRGKSAAWGPGLVLFGMKLNRKIFAVPHARRGQMNIFMLHMTVDEPLQFVDARDERLQRHADQIGQLRMFEVGAVFGSMRFAARDDLPRHADDD